MQWAVPSVVAGAPPLPLTWMKGHAGMGKTSIAQTCVEKLSAISTPFAAFLGTDLPLCWAFFSRPETHIIAAFGKFTISPLTHTVTLRKSAKTSHEIELYLRDSFKDILRCRNMPPDTQWPSDDNISRLVKAADGMFIYGATALRFIDDPQWLSLEEPLQLILESTSSTADPSLSPFADMDALYLLIMERIPARALPLVSLVLTFLCRYSAFSNTMTVYGTSMLGNCLGMSEMEVRAVCGHLSSILLLRDQQGSLPLPDGIDTSRSFLELDKNYGPTLSFFVAVKLGGSINLFHKSFCDFLCDPTRSRSYCAISPPAYHKLLKRLLDRHNQYDLCYTVDSSGSYIFPWPFK
jgi:hypothetical protein